MEKLFCHFRPFRRLLLVLALLGLAISASADDWCDFTVDNIHYVFLQGKPDEVAVSYDEYESGRYGGYYNDYSGSITVPATVTYNSVTYKVTAVGNSAFRECPSLTSVSLPNTITSIGAYAFYDCSSLNSVNIPQTVTRIGAGAFKGCVSLYSYSLSLPKTLTQIENSTFENCKLISSIVIPDSVKTIGYDAFKGCSNLYSITIPDAVTSVGSDAFYGTPWLSNQPTGVVYVGKVAYKYSGVMPEGTSLALKEGTLVVSRAAFSGCSGLVSISIPGSVTTVGASAFANCTSLQSVTIPKSIVSMGEGFSSSAFYGCTALKDVTILCPNIGYMWFREVDAIEHVTFGNEVKSIGQNAFYFCKGLSSITIPENITTIGPCAFSACVNLTSVNILNDRASIASDAFSGTPWLENQPDGLIYFGKVAYRYKGEMPEGTHFTIKDGTVEIADNAFRSCIGLASVAIPQSVERIGNYAFAYSELESVDIPEGVDSIGNYAFQYCRSLLSASVPGSAKSIGSSVFANCDNLSSVVLSEGVTDIGNSMFGSCKNLTSIVIPTSVKTIGTSAFYACTGLKSIVIPESVTTISHYAFQNSGLVSLTIPNSVSDINTSVFSGCSNLSSVTISEGVKTIGWGAFQGCTGLSSISIPRTVTTIGQSSFYGCTALTNVFISNGVKTIDGDAFHGCSGLTSITIPSSVDSIGGSAFADCSIKEVTVKTKDPISINSSVFSYYSNYSYYSYTNLATLYVPDGCKAGYESADVWKEFKEILEFGDAYSLYGTDNETLVGTKDILSIELQNQDEVKLCQFDLRLPDGVSVITMNNGKYDVTLTERTENHRVSSTRLSNGDYRFVISSLDNDSFTGNSGILINIGLDISATIEAGEYTVKVLNVELSVPDGNDLMVVKPADTESKLTVKNYTPGDVNNDGSVSVTDVGCAINYILEQVPPVFIFEAADMNGDKSVSVTDVGMIINLILNEGAASRRTEQMTMKDAQLSLMPVADGYELLLEDKDAFIGFQFDVELEEGATINNMQLDSESDHVLTCRKLSNGKWRVVCYSPTNSSFSSNKGGGLLSINAERTISLGDIRLTTAGFNELRPAPIVGTPTDIASIEQGMKMNVEGGKLCINSERDTTLRLYSLGGSIYRTLQVRKGRNSFDGLRKGIYMINNQKVIVR